MDKIRIIAINGSPRKNFSTAELLEHFLKGVESAQFTDYSRYAAGMWDEKDKRRWKEEQFPKDCAKAFEIGKQFVEEALNKRNNADESR